jgi:hypothetical protein
MLDRDLRYPWGEAVAHPENKRKSRNIILSVVVVTREDLLVPRFRYFIWNKVVCLN